MGSHEDGDRGGSDGRQAKETGTASSRRRRGGDPAHPDPGKPVAEMTPEERAKYVRSVQRWLRDQDIAAGRRAPRTMREIELWRAGMAGRDAAMDR